jgi:hypothetical protein
MKENCLCLIVLVVSHGNLCRSHLGRHVLQKVVSRPPGFRLKRSATPRLPYPGFRGGRQIPRGRHFLYKERIPPGTLSQAMIEMCNVKGERKFGAQTQEAVEQHDGVDPP